MFVDFHVHTSASDGSFAPTEVIKMATDKGIEVLSITDHDTVEGVQEISGVEGIVFVPGVEISSEYPRTLHILGYAIDPFHEKLCAVLKDLQEFRKKRNLLIVEKMNQMGFHITLEELIKEAGGGLVGRLHFASLMVKKGFVSNYQEAFDRYLGKGKPLYIDKKRLQPDEAIGLILAAGGIPVLAHPYQAEEDEEKLEDLVKKLAGFGLKGIEVFYSKHNERRISKYLELAKKYDLLVTAGTDFHGENKPDIPLGISVQYYYLREFLSEIEGRCVL
ncbi:PHP domain-containing protein [Thermotoga sp. KOL6]|uniref:PHP domain-containing protein n=1 Tax=Thermotoga sp. KOL6 TaxID=126741 RepID=UPI000C77BC7C|nr:PHP domain-containing protein [Thermotoga sp. KOL6]PLV59325.1 phosphoesterase [Thermotoga sp. KOL6]